MNKSAPNHNRIMALTLGSLMWLMAGCQANTPISVVELFSHAQCQGVKKGMQQITFADLASIRNVQMLSSSDASRPDTDSQTDDVLLFVISNGNQPTPGYSLDFANADTKDNEVELHFAWRTPEMGAILAQVMTSPCSVIQLDSHPDLVSVSAWLDDTLLERAVLQPPS